MVLLTSGHVTVIVSSAVVSLFTFLLFLAGYVVQQQTVRSLHEVFHPPPLPIPTLPVYFSDIENSTSVGGEADGNSNDGSNGAEPDQPVFKPMRGSSRQEVLAYVKSVLPPEVDESSPPTENQEGSEADADDTITVEVPVQEPLAKPEGDEGTGQVQEARVSDTLTEAQTTSEGLSPPILANVDGEMQQISLSSDPLDKINDGQAVENHPQRESEAATTGPHSDANSQLAYLMLTPTPSSICSAILFYSHLSYQKSTIPNRLILFPSFWKSNIRTNVNSEAYATALALLHEASIQHGIMVQELPLQPSIDLADPYNSASIENAMLSALAEANVSTLSYLETIKSLLYIQSPGLLINGSALDDTLISGASDGDISSAWSRYNPLGNLAYTVPEHQATPPTHLLVDLRKQTTSLSSETPHTSINIYSPSSPAIDALVLASTTVDGTPISAIDLEAQMTGKRAAYILFSEEELRERRARKDWWSGVYERFERGRREVCPADIDRDLEGSSEIEKAGAVDRSRGW